MNDENEEPEKFLYFYKGPVVVRGRLVETEYYGHTEATNELFALVQIKDAYMRRNGLNPFRSGDVVFDRNLVKIRD